MAIITREYYNNLVETGILERNDLTNLQNQSKEAGFNNGKGYSRQNFNNILKDGQSTTDAIVEFIRGYFEPKANSLKAQRQSVQKIKKLLQEAEV